MQCKATPLLSIKHQLNMFVCILFAELVAKFSYHNRKNTGIKNFKPKKFFDYPHHLKSHVPPGAEAFLGFRTVN